MRKIIFTLLTIVAMTIFTGCNYEGYDIVDTNYHFDRAVISMPNGEVIDIELDKWADSEDGEQLTLTATDGTRYLVHSANCILIEDN